MRKGDALYQMIQDYTKVLKTLDYDSPRACVIREHVTGLLVIYTHLTVGEYNETCEVVV